METFASKREFTFALPSPMGRRALGHESFSTYYNSKNELQSNQTPEDCP